MSESFKIQVNVRVGEELINLRADSPHEAEQILTWATENAPAIQSAVTALKGVSVVAGTLPVKEVQTGPWQGQQQAPPQWAQGGPEGPPQQQRSAPQSGRHCAHGAMVYRTGNGKRGPWQAYFCSAPNGDPSQCDAQFVND